MNKKNISITSPVLIILSIPLGLAAVRMPATVTVADLAKETQARKIMRQVQASAVAVAEQADLLKTIANATNSPDSHLVKLTFLKDEVNRMAQEIGSLEAERELLAPWEQQAVDRVLPLLQSAAANTGGAIDYFSVSRDRLWTATYRDYASRVYKDSGQIAAILKDYLKYEKLRALEIHAEERIWTDSNRTTE